MHQACLDDLEQIFDFPFSTLHRGYGSSQYLRRHPHRSFPPALLFSSAEESPPPKRNRLNGSKRLPGHRRLRCSGQETEPSPRGKETSRDEY
ncbi:unnamed protein product [Parascedosporium putredinis]|uniref:Uncharacterized protein n=1 Tax=Parascedosporium putredinis TaxID=1442378 RepID=A0A9P1H8E3_9PEZI|nr:unnamed protein product [Parascedosporium putredinis]CAI8002093.1 unnamed protein product [Parascedosporium putredinis]